MQYIDRNTDTGRIPDDIRPLLRGMLNNRQLFSEDPTDAPFLTEAIKYERQPQHRRETDPYIGDDEFVSSIIDIFGFDPLDFQVESWQTVDRLDQLRREEDQTKAAVFSAPTGFGKTEAFLGPLYQLLREERQESVAIVYPSRALLQDQLGRIIEHIHTLDTNHDEKLSVGIYAGGMPYEKSQVETNRTVFESGTGRPRFKFSNCWCGDDGANAFEFHGTGQSYYIQCEENPEHRLTDQQLVLARKDLVFSTQPDIVLTTLESLEAFAHKPHYPLIDTFDTIVLDEVHLYTQLRGAHAAKIIQNVNEITDDPLLWLGSSATIDDAKRFGRRIFNVNNSDIENIEPPESDYNREHDDKEHYYFMLASEDGPGSTPLAIQQLMLLGHTMLEDQDGERSKALSFIDSISQVNQKSVQLHDADNSRELWEYHRGHDDVENWDQVATEMGQQFIDEPLDFMSVYSDAGFDSEETQASDVLLSTSFLEVGIDVGEIKIVSQYRTPWDLSSFLQRAGRAARKTGMDSHIAVFLSNLTNDANMFYRADRFLDSDIRTPLKTDNKVVEWMHDRFRRYYDHADRVKDEFYRSQLDEHTEFLEAYLKDDLGYDAYYDLIINPASFFERELGIEVGPDRLLSETVITDVKESLETHLESQRAEFDDIRHHFEMKDGEVILGENAVDRYILEVQEQTLRVINTYLGQVSGFESHLHGRGVSDHDSLTQSLRDQLTTFRERAARLPEGNAEEQASHYSSLLADLFGLTGQLMQLRNHANGVSDDPVPTVNQSRLTELSDAVTQLEALTEDDRLTEYYRQEKQIHYITEALDEIESYLGYQNPYLSLYAIKDLLRGAYYLDRYFRTDDRQLDDEVWFTPPDYYGSAGQFVTVLRGEDDVDGNEESIDQLMSTFAPYRSEYQSESGSMRAFLPTTEVTEDGVQFDFMRDVTGEKQEGILVPDTIQLSEVNDLTEGSGLNIVQYCPECFQILPGDIGNCLRHDEREYGKVHSEPHVDTTVTDRTPVESTGDLTLADLEATVSLESVTLSINPAKYYGPDLGVNFDSSRESFEQTIESGSPPIGYYSETRGLVFDMEPLFESTEDELREYVTRYKDLTDIDFEELTYHTAAHFFLQLVADVSSVSTQMLFYGYDQEAQEVYVFERTEGGQGIVDLVYDELTVDPASILDSITRIAYNAQVINERLWANAAFVGEIPIAGTETDDIRPVVEDYVPLPYGEVIDRVVQEVLSTVDRVHQFADDTPISVADAFEIKHTVAKEQVAGTDKFPETAIEKLDVDVEDTGRVRTMFYSPDIDGCVENLHLSECISAGEQTETLSYVVLEKIREHLLHTVSVEDASETMFEHELPPAGELNGTSIFLDF
jgi:superfamily II DNA/RNA helicase